MLKYIFLLVVIQLFTSISGDTSCVIQRHYVKSVCDHAPESLTLTSAPGQIVLDKKKCNNEYDKREWQKTPQIKYAEADPAKTYTVVCLDPNAPLHKEGEYYLHWIVSNIKGEDFANGDLSKANHLTPYKGPGPPQGTGTHHYIFLVFEEKRPNREITNPSERPKFALLPWVEGQKNKLCGPVAGIQFRSQY